MALLYMSMAGEGRGHATRMRALVEALRSRHRIRLFAPGAAYDLLSPAYRDTEVQVTPIPGLPNVYSSERELNYAATLRKSAHFFRRLPSVLRRLQTEFSRERPDLVVCDFEPVLPRAADRCRVPCMVVDHQHFLIVSDLSELPLRLRFHATTLGWVVRFIYRRPRTVVLSSFHTAPLKPGTRSVRQVGPFLRPSVLRARPGPGRHLLVYLRRFAPPKLLEGLFRLGRPTIIYGLGALPAEGSLTFKDVEEDAFVADLASAQALITTAGNQIVGEAMYLEKPVLAMPEANNFEQAINAHFLVESGAGIAVPLEECGFEQLVDFVARLSQFRALPRTTRSNGTPDAVEAIEGELARLDGPPPAKGEAAQRTTMSARSNDTVPLTTPKATPPARGAGVSQSCSSEPSAPRSSVTRVPPAERRMRTSIGPASPSSGSKTG